MKIFALIYVAILTIVFDLDALRIRKAGEGVFGKVGDPRLLLYTDVPPDEWIEQNLDHYNPTDNRTWNQRYYTNDTFYENGGPVFLMIGGEGTASPSWMVQGAWIEYAQQLNALCFQVEHRYYGESRPTDDLSVENLVYLSSEQALADLANFVVAMNKKYQLPEGTKWIAFGGSYSGSLAAWLRAKYSHLVHAAVSSSGPLLAKLNFEEYLAVVRNSLATIGGEDCATAVQEAFDSINLSSQDTDLKSLFRLCDEVSDLTENDISNFYETLADSMAGIVQYNQDNRNSITANITIDYVCSILTDESVGTPVERYAAFISVLQDVQGSECLDFKYDKMISEYRNTSWESDAATGSRQWVYQTCTEFGFYQTSDAKPRTFGENITLKYFIQQCNDIYGEEFTYIRMSDAIARTNVIYGARSIDTSRVVYVHGSIDPWHVLGITESESQDAPAIFINGTAHCADMYPSTPDDFPNLTEARTKIFQYLQQWLGE